MINDIKKEIEEVNSSLESLPKNNKKNIEKYNEYIDEILAKYKPMLIECEAIIKGRYVRISNKFKDLTFEPIESKIDYNSLKLSDMRVRSSEKMNLDYLFFKLENSELNNLKDENEIILEILGLFKECGVELTAKEFNYSDNVHTYFKALLSNDQNIQDIFNKLFWQSPDIMKQIELNIKSLYYKYESKIDNYYKEKYETFDFDTFILNHRNSVYANEVLKHKSVKYIFDLFITEKFDTDDFLVESRVQDLINSLLTDPSSEKNYDNLLKLKKSLLEFEEFNKFQYIIDDFKELFQKREEYKTVFSDKLKEISTKEKNLFKINKKIENKGLFKLNKNKIADQKLMRNSIIKELVTDYETLDELKIKDTISKYVTNETNYYDILKFTSYNFCYFIKLLEKQNEEINIENINDHMLKLNQYIYDNSMEIINNITINDEKNIPKIISDMYKLNSLNVEEEKVVPEQIRKTIDNVDKLLLYFDIYALSINLKEIKFLVTAPSMIKKEKEKDKES